MKGAWIRVATKWVVTGVLAAAGLPFTVVAAEAVTHAGSVTVGNELVVMADGPGKELRGGQSVAYGKDRYLAVWREGWIGEGGQSRIYAARITRDGKLLDPKGIEVAPGKGGPQDRPRVAFVGSSFLVVWQDFSNGKDMDVRGARVGLDGKVVDAKPIAIAVGPRTQVMPEIASNGKDGGLVVWQGFQGNEENGRAFGVPVSADGVVGQPVVFDCTPKPKVVWNGSCYLAYGGPRGVFSAICFQKLTADGKLDGGGWKRIGHVEAGGNGGGQNWAVGARPGKGWLIVCDRTAPNFWGWGGPGGMRCYSMLEDGSLDKTMPNEPPIPKYNKLQSNWVDAVWDPKSGRTWPYGQSAIAWDGRQSLVFWTRYHFGGAQGMTLVNGDIMVARVDGWKSLDGTHPVPVAATSGHELNPAVAVDDAGAILCVYEKGVEGNTVLCARLVTAVADRDAAVPPGGTTTRESR